MSPSKLTVRSTVQELIGASPWTAQMRRDIDRVAGVDSSVLVTGPTGTGKELIASALHGHSRRVQKPFIAINCAAVAPSLFASHMFGHEKGAFTGADYAAKGCFRAADGGTIFLDEIGELNIDLQARLLRVLQERVVTPVGAYEGHPVDVRLVAATNRDLRREVSVGRFREDLLYRLNVVTLRTLPLRQRKDDIVPLAQYWLERLAERQGLPRRKLGPEAAQWVIQRDWPGNVRQLQNVLERAVIFSDSDYLGVDDMEAAVFDDSMAEDSSFGQFSGDEYAFDQGFDDVAPVDARDDDDQTTRHAKRFGLEGGLGNRIAPEMPGCTRSIGHPLQDANFRWPQLDDVECAHIRRTLELTSFNQSAAANLLGVTFRTLARKIRRYRIDISLSRRGRPRHGRPQPREDAAS